MRSRPGTVSFLARLPASPPPRALRPSPPLRPSVRPSGVRRRGGPSRGASASFPTGSPVCKQRGRYAILSGRWSGRARPPRRLPPRLRPDPRGPGDRRVRVAAAVGRSRPAPASWPRVSARLLSGYLAVAFRRGGLKTPGGSPSRPRGRGAVGPAGRVGRPALSQTLSAPPAAAAPEAAVGGLPGAPSGRPWGPARAPDSPAFRRSDVGRRVRGPVSCPFVFPVSRPSFFFPRVCFVSRWPARGEPSIRPVSSEGGRAGVLCRRQHP